MNNSSSIFSRVRAKLSGYFCTPLENSSYLKGLAAVLVFLFLLCGAIVFWIDPYMYFHRSFLKESYFDNAYAMIPGVLRQYDYDCILLGSSICQNMKISQINEKLSCKAVKAAAPGISPDAMEHFFTIARRARGEKLQKVLIGLDIFTFTKTGGPWKEYAYLYRRKPVPMEYLFSTDSLSASWEALRKNLRYSLNKKKRDPKMDFDTMFHYREKPSQYTGKSLEDNVRSALNNPPAVDIDATWKNLEKHLFRHIRQNPQIRFEIFLPPYHAYFWCTLQSMNKLEAYLKVRTLLAKHLAEFPNVRLHDFQAATFITTVDSNYKDVTHYKQELNSLLLQKIRNSSSRLAAPSAAEENTRKIRLMTEQAMPAFRKLASGK